MSASMGIYRRLLQYIKPHKGRLILAALAAQGYALSTSLVSATLYVIINGLQNKSEVRLTNLPHIRFLQDIAFPSAWIPYIIVTVFLLRSFFEYISQYQMASVGIRVIRRVRDDLFRHLTYLSSDFYSKGRTGDFLSRILNDVGQIQGAITDVLTDLIKQPFIILYNIPMVFIWGGPYAIFAIIIFPVVAVPIVFLGRQLRKTTKRMQERAADITAFIGETLAGIHIVKAFNREEEEIRTFEKINRSVFDFFKSTIKLTMIQRPLIEVMGAIGAAIAVAFALKTLPPDRFGAFVISLFVFYEPLKKLSKVNSTIQQSLAAGGRIFEILDSEPSIKDAPDAEVFKGPIETIRYRNVHFYYEAGKEVLRGIDLNVKHGEVVALVGPSGAGKSTMANLLLRFYDPAAGSLEINDCDIRKMTLKSLREKIGIVAQDTILFNMTVAENIAFGAPNASREDIEKAAHAAYAHGFIEALPQGYETPLGERGLKLSGGQRQRISIARAILKNAPILILDEATSHLDADSERMIQDALENLMVGRTVFVIAHRLATVQRATRILVLDDGKIIQQGTNESLLEQGGTYKRLYDLQFNV
ncbi:MAG TPA: ABC transporter ATP-binding protein [Verrucomicrobiae bacterium]|nr:ABC transporter ATP-binding protein [Verrucomicrobiae bacterium]